MFDFAWCTPKLLDKLKCKSKGENREGQGVEAHSLICSTSEIKRRVGAPGWGLKWMTNGSIIHMDLHKPNNNWSMCSWSTFGAWTNHGQTWIHKIHHDPDLGEATTFPLIIFSMPTHGACTQMSFCLGTPKLGIPKLSKLGFPWFWGAITSC